MSVLWSEVYIHSRQLLIDGLGILFARSYQRPWNQARQFTQAVAFGFIGYTRKKNYNT